MKTCLFGNICFHNRDVYSLRLQAALRPDHTGNWIVIHFWSSVDMALEC